MKFPITRAHSGCQTASANKRPVARSREHSQPIRGQYGCPSKRLAPGHNYPDWLNVCHLTLDPARFSLAVDVTLRPSYWLTRTTSVLTLDPCLIQVTRAARAQSDSDLFPLSRHSFPLTVLTLFALNWMSPR